MERKCIEARCNKGAILITWQWMVRLYCWKGEMQRYARKYTLRCRVFCKTMHLKLNLHTKRHNVNRAQNIRPEPMSHHCHSIAAVPCASLIGCLTPMSLSNLKPLSFPDNCDKSKFCMFYPWLITSFIVLDFCLLFFSKVRFPRVIHNNKSAVEREKSYIQ